MAAAIGDRRNGVNMKTLLNGWYAEEALAED
jgi:hypothetical protein